MATIFPRDIVDQLERHYSWLRAPESPDERRGAIHAPASAGARAAAALLVELPSEHLRLDPAEYSAFLIATNELRRAVDGWDGPERSNTSLPASIAALTGRNPLRVIWEMLKKSQDALDAETTTPASTRTIV